MSSCGLTPPAAREATTLSSLSRGAAPQRATSARKAGKYTIAEALPPPPRLCRRSATSEATRPAQWVQLASWSHQGLRPMSQGRPGEEPVQDAMPVGASHTDALSPESGYGSGAVGERLGALVLSPGSGSGSAPVAYGNDVETATATIVTMQSATAPMPAIFHQGHLDAGGASSGAGTRRKLASSPRPSSSAGASASPSRRAGAVRSALEDIMPRHPGRKSGGLTPPKSTAMYRGGKPLEAFPGASAGTGQVWVCAHQRSVACAIDRAARQLHRRA
mmetsp:Transcript_20222/g.77619  ORF Transcript_20222/g.77619 Transcript_20222/m.77619 type:complete len:276 (-) Transcript_20222:31-858(-)